MNPLAVLLPPSDAPEAALLDCNACDEGAEGESDEDNDGVEPNKSQRGSGSDENVGDSSGYTKSDAEDGSGTEECLDNQSAVDVSRENESEDAKFAGCRDKDSCEHFVVHVNFGGEQLASLSRTVRYLTWTLDILLHVMGHAKLLFILHRQYALKRQCIFLYCSLPIFVWCAR